MRRATRRIPRPRRAEMEKERGDYRAIAERRVRLGLLLSEIGQKNGVQISQQEMNQLIMQAAQQYRPEDRQNFVDYVRSEPMAAAQLRAPLFEDKVVDHLFGNAEISEREVEPRGARGRDRIRGGHVHGPGCGHDHDHGQAEGEEGRGEEAGGQEAKAAKPAKKAAGQEAPAKKSEKPSALS